MKRVFGITWGLMALVAWSYVGCKPDPRSFLYSASQPTASVRQGLSICDKEKAAYAMRASCVSSCLSKYVGRSISAEQIPQIGVAASGGGMRAAIATLGFLRGLEKIGLLDAVTYFASLSGSTWTTAAWMVHEKPLDELTLFLQKKSKDPLSLESLKEEEVMDALWDKLSTFKMLSLNDLWGGLIADIFLSTPEKNGQKLYITDIEESVAQGKYPIPLFTCLHGETSPNYEWAEFSPFEAGSCYTQTWIPAAAIGKKFNGGVSFDNRVGETLAFLLGTFGSAYAANFQDVVQAIKETLEAYYDLSVPSMCVDFSLLENDVRLSPPYVYNFTAGLANVMLSNEQWLTFIDGGFAFNVPFPPLLRRNVKLYFVCDASDDNYSAVGNDMHEVEAYAKKEGFKFPTIDYKKLVTDRLSVFYDPKDKTVPIIVYVRNFEKFSTLKFDWTDEEFERLYKGIESAIVDNAELIKQAVELAVNN